MSFNVGAHISTSFEKAGMSSSVSIPGEIVWNRSGCSINHDKNAGRIPLSKARYSRVPEKLGMYLESCSPHVHDMGFALAHSRRISSRFGNSETRNVKAGAQVLRYLNFKERRGSAMGSKHLTREVFSNRSMLKGVIVRCWIGDEARDSIKRARVDGLAQGTEPHVSPRSSTSVIQGAIAAAVSSVLQNHGMRSLGVRMTRLKSFCCERRVQALPINEAEFRSRLVERWSIISSMSSWNNFIGVGSLWYIGNQLRMAGFRTGSHAPLGGSVRGVVPSPKLFSVVFDPRGMRGRFEWSGLSGQS